MSVASVFQFQFAPDKIDEGLEVARAIGADMRPTEGYLRHEVIRDLSDAAHVAVITYWAEQSQGDAVLRTYSNDPKIQRATDLLGSEPAGFLGVLD